ncbi:MAG: SET domain-containing protein [Bacteroidota bacterium]|nr:SET domain-containing protein [Bacteroidota bacterium]
MEQQNPETIIVKDCKFGKGIFTTIDLPKNSVLFKITGKPLTFDGTLALGNDECYCLQIAINKYIIPDYPFHLSNHSCDPNCGINRRMEFITLRNVTAGEEILWDYSTSMLEKHWAMQCDCGSLNCRQIIRDFDELTMDVQERYLNMEIVLPYIVEHLYGLPKIEQWPQLMHYPSVRYLLIGNMPSTNC